MIACATTVPGSWWPIVTVSLLVGVAIGLGIGNWIMRELRREHEVEVGRMIHPSWTGTIVAGGHVDGSTGRGEMWEVGDDGGT